VLGRRRLEAEPLQASRDLLAVVGVHLAAPGLDPVAAIAGEIRMISNRKSSLIFTSWRACWRALSVTTAPASIRASVDSGLRVEPRDAVSVRPLALSYQFDSERREARDLREW
jgi:hypothetical protein